MFVKGFHVSCKVICWVHDTANTTNCKTFANIMCGRLIIYTTGSKIWCFIVNFRLNKGKIKNIFFFIKKYKLFFIKEFVYDWVIICKLFPYKSSPHLTKGLRY